MRVIEVSHLTKDYGNHRGIFDVCFSINQGEVIGFLGPNGSGKTTTIRHLMGFIQPHQGTASILGKDCFKEAEQIHSHLGYLPGEIAFMDDMKGIDFIRFMAEMKNIKDMSKVKRLIDYFELDACGKIKKMSKGMKQKIGLVIAFMQDVPVMILDEPTSGLDPLMQNKFVELIQQEKKKGKTILMSSHIFEEIENTCDRVIMIKDGYIIADKIMEDVKNQNNQQYEITFYSEKEARKFERKYFGQRKMNIVMFQFAGNMNQLIKDLSFYQVKNLKTKGQTLEELFLNYYGEQYDD